MTQPITQEYDERIKRRQYSDLQRQNHQNQNTRPWSQVEDDTLIDCVVDGMAYRDIAKKLNRSRNACIGRMHRLAKQMGDRQR